MNTNRSSGTPHSEARELLWHLNLFTAIKIYVMSMCTHNVHVLECQHIVVVVVVVVILQFHTYSIWQICSSRNCRWKMCH